MKRRELCKTLKSVMPIKATAKWERDEKPPEAIKR